MEVLILTIFVSLVLVVAAGVFFAWNVHQRSHEQSDRLVLLPLADEHTVAHVPARAGSTAGAPCQTTADASAATPHPPGAPNAAGCAHFLRENSDDNH